MLKACHFLTIVLAPLPRIIPKTIKVWIMTLTIRKLASTILIGTFFLSACGDESEVTETLVTTPVSQTNNEPVLSKPNSNQTIRTGTAFNYDVSQANSTFTDADNDTLSYIIAISPTVAGITINNNIISGLVSEVQTCTVDITVNDGNGGSATDSFTMTIQAAAVGELNEPALPVVKFNYENQDLPLHFTDPNHPLGDLPIENNTPANNPLTDAGATLGRVLFYDKRLSLTDTISCSSCHIQANGFSDPETLSVGFQGGLTDRHSMGLANAAYYQRGRFFWDERAATLEDQVLEPIENVVEMGSELNALVGELSGTTFYAALFEEAFGTSDITSERMSLALAQFVRSLKSYESKYDAGVATNFSNFTAQEAQGHRLFSNNAPGNGRSVGCNRCHEKAAQVGDNIRNNGLDLDTSSDQGAGNGRFKVASLRNIAVRAPFMHDGRFNTLEEVIEFYNSGVQAHPNLDNRLIQNGNPRLLNLTEAEKTAMVVFLNTLTDNEFISDEKFSNPFVEQTN